MWILKEILREVTWFHSSNDLRNQSPTPYLQRKKKNLSLKEVKGLAHAHQTSYWQSYSQEKSRTLIATPVNIVCAVLSPSKFRNSWITAVQSSTYSKNSYVFLYRLT